MSAVESITEEELRTDEAWWQIYEDAFPVSEREPRDVILASVARGVGMAFRAHYNGMTLGLAATHLLGDPAAVFLVYLAVARGERDRGIGGELFESAWRSGAARLRAKGLQPLGVIWEVEPLQSGADDAEARTRRVAFFQRHGGQLLDRRYLQPPVNGIAAVPMRLMFKPATAQETPAPGKVEALVRAIYFEKYQAINGINRSILEDLLTAQSKKSVLNNSLEGEAKGT